MYSYTRLGVIFFMSEKANYRILIFINFTISIIQQVVQSQLLNPSLFLHRAPQKHLREYITYVFHLFCLNSGKPFPNLITQYKAIHYEGKHIKAPPSSINTNSMKTEEILELKAFDSCLFLPATAEMGSSVHPN